MVASGWLKKPLSVSASRPRIVVSSGISIIQVVAATMCASLLVTSSLVSENHAPPSARSTRDLPTPCPPLRMSTLSTLHPGRRARATAEMAHLRPMAAVRALSWTPKNFWSQVSRRFFPSHWRLCRYSFRGSYRWSLATSRSCSATVADFMCILNLLWESQLATGTERSLSERTGMGATMSMLCVSSLNARLPAHSG